MADDQKASDYIKLVKEGYNEIATTYESTIDKSIPNLAIFKKFVSLIKNQKRILDLGCGSGSKVSWYFFENSFDYIGVDISEEQLALAKKSFPKFADHFIEDEMLEFCKSQNDNTFDGLLALFSIFHLPLTQQLELFKELTRILTDGAPFLLSTSNSDDEGIEENWLGGTKPMYWSNKPTDWYETTLTELGYTIREREKRTSYFYDEEETIWFVLFQK